MWENLSKIKAIMNKYYEMIKSLKTSHIIETECLTMPHLIKNIFK